MKASGNRIVLLVKQSAAVLLLRKFYRIYTEEDFHFAKRIMASFNWNEMELEADLTASFRK